MEARLRADASAWRARVYLAVRASTPVPRWNKEKSLRYAERRWGKASLPSLPSGLVGAGRCILADAR